LATRETILGRVALLLVGYKRADFLVDRLEELKSNQPIPIKVSIDGSDPKTEAEISQVVNLFAEMNPEMDITLNIHKRNLGLAHHISSSISTLFDEYSGLIIVEDDIVMSSKFVEIMLSGLRMSLKDKEIGAIAGFSAFSGVDRFSHKNLFRKSEYFPGWGWAIYQDKWKKFELTLPPDFDSRLTESQAWNRLSAYRKSLWRSRFSKVLGTNPPTWDYQMQYMIFQNDFKVLNTTQRVTDNVGFSSTRSTNTVGNRPRWMKNVGVSSSPFKESISKISKFYSWVDCYTIGGDTRPFIFVNNLIEIAKNKVSFLKN
jgi:hypothetical protein